MKYADALAIFLCTGLAHCNLEEDKNNHGDAVMDIPPYDSGSSKSSLDAVRSSQPSLDVEESSQPRPEEAGPSKLTAEEKQALLDWFHIKKIDPKGQSEQPLDVAGTSQQPTDEAGASKLIDNEHQELIDLFHIKQIDPKKSEASEFKGFPNDAFTKFSEHQRRRVRRAIEDRNVESTRAIIEEGVDLIAPYKDSKTALHVASIQSKRKSKEVLKLLLSKNVPLEARTNCGETAFGMAVMAGNMDGAAILLEAGAEINAADNYGYTPLHWKIYGSLFEGVGWLLRYGASLYPVDNNERNPLDVALYHDSKPYDDAPYYELNPYHNAPYCELNPYHNAPYCERDPIDNAVYWKGTKIVRLLIEYGADISAPKYEPDKIFEKYWESCFRKCKSNFDDFDDFVTSVVRVFLAEQPEDDYFPDVVQLSEYDHFPDQDDKLSIYSKIEVFALYRILKEMYPEWNTKWEQSRLESAKAIFFEIITNKIIEDTHSGKGPLKMKCLVSSERIFWNIERLSFYLALKSFFGDCFEVRDAFTSEEITHFIKSYIE